MKMNAFEKIENLREIRKGTGKNQQQFWSEIGITQSGGSRYESGRNIPKSIRALIKIVHIEKIALSEINGDDFKIAQLLKTEEPELYKKIKSMAKKV